MERTSRSSLSSCLRSRSWQTTLMVPRPVSLWVSASIAVADVTLQRLRYVSRPDELAFTGTEPV
jgi:hypothetical protein